MKQIDITILHCTVGASDKLYRVTLYENTKSRQYEIHTEYGRRGQAMIINPVLGFETFRVAKDRFDNIVWTKTKKQYLDITEDSDREARYNEAVIKQLHTEAAVLCAEGSLERNQYESIKRMLSSGDEPSQVLAEEMIKAKNEKLEAA